MSIIDRESKKAILPTPSGTGRRSSRVLITMIALLAVGAAEAAAQSWVLSPQLDEVFARLDGPDAPGCAAGVIAGGELVHARGYGSANLDYGIPLDARSVFYLASVSKQFTAAAVLLAAEQGHISLDDEVRRWIPELPDYGVPLTIRHLVHHTSGLRDYLALMSLNGTPYGNAFGDEAMLGLIARQRALNFQPGSEYLYSNTGYVLMAEIVRRATGRSLRAFSDDEIFRPLGMADTHFHDQASEVVPRRVISYVRGSEGTFRVSYLPHFDRVGDGGLYSTIEDLSRWMNALMEDRVGTPGFAERLLERGVLSNGDTISYAFGLTVGELRGVREVAHGGSMMGFRTSLRIFPDERAGTVALCNLGHIDPTRLTLEMAEVVLGDRLAASDLVAETPGDGGVSGSAAEAGGAFPELDESGRAAITGRYHSDELGAEYRIDSVDGALALVAAGRAPLPLAAEDGDRLRTPQGHVLRLNRDEDGAVSGFLLDLGRVRGIEFERVEGRMPQDRVRAH